MLSFNAVLRSYAWDGNRELYVKSGSSAYYQITDPHGDNVAWASATALVGTAHFDPWGQPTYTPSGTTTPFGFQGAAGSWTDATTSFVSVGVRWYYPKISQFLSSDPAAGTADPRTPIDRMRWLYGAEDPLIHIDPTGRANACDCQDSASNTGNPTWTPAPLPKKATPAPVVCGRGYCVPRAQNTACNIGRQSCGTYAANFGKQLLNIACGLTVCPAIHSAQETYKLVTDPTGFWQDQTAEWNGDKAYWSDVYKTYQKAESAPGGTIPGVAEGYFALKWSADRLQDFDKDPGTASANIVVFFATALVPASRLSEAGEITSADTRAVVIGQGMDRVKATAVERGADFYQGATDWVGSLPKVVRDPITNGTTHDGSTT